MYLPWVRRAFVSWFSRSNRLSLIRRRNRWFPSSNAKLFIPAFDNKKSITMAPSSKFLTKNWINEVTPGINLPYRPDVAFAPTLRRDSQAASSFFAFPPELRNLIYYHLLTTRYTVGGSRASRFKKTIDHPSSYCEIWNSPRFNVLRVCQQARDEALHNLYLKRALPTPHQASRTSSVLSELRSSVSAPANTFSTPHCKIPSVFSGVRGPTVVLKAAWWPEYHEGDMPYYFWIGIRRKWHSRTSHTRSADPYQFADTQLRLDINIDINFSTKGLGLFSDIQAEAGAHTWARIHGRTWRACLFDIPSTKAPVEKSQLRLKTSSIAGENPKTMDNKLRIPRV